MPCNHNSLSVGGVTLHRESGATTHASPVACFCGLSDTQVQEFWHWWLSNEKVAKAQAEFHKIVAQELTAWGDSRAATS